MSITPEQAIRTYPELARLAELKGAGWSFHPLGDPAEPQGIAGMRHRGGYSDFLFILGRTETRTVRLLTDAPGAPGGIVWSREGPLVETVIALLELPPPDDPRAPRLAIGHKSLLDWVTARITQATQETTRDPKGGHWGLQIGNQNDATPTAVGHVRDGGGARRGPHRVYGRAGPDRSCSGDRGLTGEATTAPSADAARASSC